MDSRVARHRQQYQKKSFYQCWWFWVIIAILVVGVMGKLLTPSADSQTSDQKSELFLTVDYDTKHLDNQNHAKITFKTNSDNNYAIVDKGANIIIGKGKTEDGKVQLDFQNAGKYQIVAYQDGQYKSITVTILNQEKQPETSQQPKPEPKPETPPANTQPATDQNKSNETKVPNDYKAALKSAQEYSDQMHMSQQGLYQQLTSEYGEKFSAQAAQYAIENVKADYNTNALKTAQSYQKMGDMSTESIREQLTSEYGEQFTPEQADYAIQHLNG